MTALEPPPPDPSPDEAPPVVLAPLAAAPRPPPRRLRRAFAALPDAIPSLAVLFAIGMSVGLFAWTELAQPPLVPFVTTNELERVPRIVEMVWIADGAAVFGVLLPLVWRVRRGPDALAPLAQRLLPLALLGFVPLLFRWKIWQGGPGELSFLALASIVGLVAGPLFARAAAAPPLFPRLAHARWFAALRARLTAPPRWLTISLACAGALGYAVFFSYYTINHHRNVRSTSLDLGLENNILWNIVHGGPFFKVAPLLGPTGSHFGYHAYFFAYVIAPIYALWQRPEMLLIIQATLMGGGAIPLYFIAERRLGRAMACLLALCFVLYAPLHGANLYDFHYTPLSTFFLLTTFYFLDTRRNVLAVIAVILTLSVREDVPPGLVVIGLYLIFSRERPRAGLVLAVAAGLYFVVLKMIVMPRWLADASSYTYIYQGLIPTGEKGFGGVLKTLIGNPGFTLGSLLERDKLVYVLRLLAPLAFIPVWRGPTWVLFLPAFLFTLLSTGYAPVIQTSFQYTAHWTTYVFLAAAIHLGAARAEGRGGRRRAGAWMGAAVLASLACSYQDGAFFQRQHVHGGFGIYKFTTDADDLARRAEMRDLVAMVPPRAKIAGSETVVPQISSRPDAYTLRLGVFDSEYILFSLHEDIEGEHAAAAEVLRANQFGVVAVRPHFALIKRGHRTDLNAAVLARIGS